VNVCRAEFHSGGPARFAESRHRAASGRVYRRHGESQAQPGGTGSHAGRRSSSAYIEFRTQPPSRLIHLRAGGDQCSHGPVEFSIEGATETVQRCLHIVPQPVSLSDSDLRSTGTASTARIPQSRARAPTVTQENTARRFALSMSIGYTSRPHASKMCVNGHRLFPTVSDSRGVACKVSVNL
jgi:hypothetical protein